MSQPRRWEIAVCDVCGDVITSMRHGSDPLHHVEVMPVEEHDRVIASLKSRLEILGDTIGDLARLRSEIGRLNVIANPPIEEPDGSMVSAARGIEHGPESERSATSPRPDSTTRAANLSAPGQEQRES